MGARPCRMRRKRAALDVDETTAKSRLDRPLRLNRTGSMWKSSVRGTKDTNGQPAEPATISSLAVARGQAPTTVQQPCSRYYGCCFETCVCSSLAYRPGARRGVPKAVFDLHRAREGLRSVIRHVQGRNGSHSGGCMQADAPSRDLELFGRVPATTLWMEMSDSCLPRTCRAPEDR